MRLFLSTLRRFIVFLFFKAASEFDLSRCLVKFSRRDEFTIADACAGVFCVGATGSGKTTGSGRTLAKAFLRAGFGGLVLTAKVDEADLWREYCEECGRTDSLVFIGPDHPECFNFLDYEVNRPGTGAGLTPNITAIFMNILEVAERKSGNAASGDVYWMRTLQQMCNCAIEILIIARGTVTVPDLYEFIMSAALSAEQVHDPQWQENSLCYQCIMTGESKPKTKTQARDFELSARYWLREMPTLAEKTRSIIQSTFTSLADCFMRGLMGDLFCTQTTWVPELTTHGVITVLDMPPKEYGEVGQFGQVAVKYLWQKAMERRDVRANPRPVFLWADEAHLFTTKHDATFQTTARSARVATVMLTQSLANLYAVAPGDQGRHQMDTLLGCLSTKIVHASNCTVTNEWMAKLIGRDRQWRGSFSSGGGNRSDIAGVAIGGGQSSGNAGGSETMDFQIETRVFTELQRGGPPNFAVEGIVTQSGRLWDATGKNYLRTFFDQRA